jgi:hypothetical protein
MGKKIKEVDSLLEEPDFVPNNITGSAKKVHPGCPSFLKPIKDDLYVLIKKFRDQGVQTTNHMVLREASRLLPSFNLKSFHAKHQAVNRITKQLGFTRRVATHTAQKHFKETEKESKDFINMVKARLRGRSKDDVINMDQTPIQFSFHSQTTLEVKGKKTIQVRASSNDMKRITLAATVTASGTMLTPFMIFKGTPNGRIFKNEFHTFPAGGKYTCPPKAWMDEPNMHA